MFDSGSSVVVVVNASFGLCRDIHQGRRDMSIATSSRSHVISDNVGLFRLSDREVQSVPTREKKKLHCHMGA
jgi:hypothetical protein